MCYYNEYHIQAGGFLCNGQISLNRYESKGFDKKAIWKYFLNSSSVGTNKVLYFRP